MARRFMMPMTAAIIQSNYMPWKGYFDIIQAVEAFVFLDDVQYTRRDWRNRNVIKTAQGLKWLTIPVATAGKYANERVMDVRVSSRDWVESHIGMIREHYRMAPCFREVFPVLDELYRQAAPLIRLSEINAHMIRGLCGFMGIETPLWFSTDYFSPSELDDMGPTERLAALCRKVGATRYVSGPAARDYMDVEVFAEAGIEVLWADYSRYPPYAQLHGDFVHLVSIIDTLMMLGKGTAAYLASASCVM